MTVGAKGLTLRLEDELRADLALIVEYERRVTKSRSLRCMIKERANQIRQEQAYLKSVNEIQTPAPESSPEGPERAPDEGQNPAVESPAALPLPPFDPPTDDGPAAELQAEELPAEPIEPAPFTVDDVPAWAVVPFKKLKKREPLFGTGSYFSRFCVAMMLCRTFFSSKEACDSWLSWRYPHHSDDDDQNARALEFAALALCERVEVDPAEK